MNENINNKLNYCLDRGRFANVNSRGKKVNEAVQQLAHWFHLYSQSNIQISNRF